MERQTHRKRKPVSARGARVLTMIGFRYSISRDAYVLRVVGNRHGPVYAVAAGPKPQREEPESTGGPDPLAIS